MRKGMEVWLTGLLFLNTIIPGVYPSELTRRSMAEHPKCPGIERHEEYFTDAEEDFAGAILFLASRAGVYINGECLLSDGGRLAQLTATY
ncbi:hypothetical protein GGR57DRAFT_17787 [Xylariaceae sp. FL1272]|nr:hypothetical protein GGR57DRAFT_17787 [Xylariaceae sp. FL1272]